LLLERVDVDPNLADNFKRTPLLWAVENGRTEAVKLLLERADVDPNLADNDGRTPLLWTAETGRTEV
ncbi:unnamed protein product, partial [Tuber aestivum]